MRKDRMDETTGVIDYDNLVNIMDNLLAQWSKIAGFSFEA